MEVIRAASDKQETSKTTKILNYITKKVPPFPGIIVPRVDFAFDVSYVSHLSVQPVSVIVQIGCGGIGSALARLLLNILWLQNSQYFLYLIYDGDIVELRNTNRQFLDYIPGLYKPQTVKITSWTCTDSSLQSKVDEICPIITKDLTYKIGDSPFTVVAIPEYFSYDKFMAYRNFELLLPDINALEQETKTKKLNSMIFVCAVDNANVRKELIKTVDELSKDEIIREKVACLALVDVGNNDQYAQCITNVAWDNVKLHGTTFIRKLYEMLGTTGFTNEINDEIPGFLRDLQMLTGRDISCQDLDQIVFLNNLYAAMLAFTHIVAIMVGYRRNAYEIVTREGYCVRWKNHLKEHPAFKS